MTKITQDALFAELRKIDTPTITNVVATYPKNPLCLDPLHLSGDGRQHRPCRDLRVWDA